MRYCRLNYQHHYQVDTKTEGHRHWSGAYLVPALSWKYCPASLCCVLALTWSVELCRPDTDLCNLKMIYSCVQAHAPKQPQQQHQQHQALPDDEQCPDEALFKTRMCVYYQQGRCQRGSACTFAHDPSELQAYDPARRYTHQVV